MIRRARRPDGSRFVAACWRRGCFAGAGKLFHVLTVLLLTAGCADPPVPADDADWLDYFEVVDTVTMADSVLRPLLVDRMTFTEQPWRMGGVGSEPWLLTPQDGERVAEKAMGYPPDHDVSYWSSWTHTYGARTDHTVFAAATFTYVIRMYGAGRTTRDSISTPPPSWVQGHRPEMGEFAGKRQEDFDAYLRGLTVITGLAAVSDSTLIVAHGRYRDEAFGQPPGDIDLLLTGHNPSPRPHVHVSDYLNLYVNGTRVVTDAPAPGEILGYTRKRLVFGRRLPGDAGTMLIEYAWKRR